ncbi:MAG: FecR domain-containing protein, partial [Spirochaetaceae bacterium]|nr:FecR domain-containing protein [Spirochaetaceae bacterium]
MKRFLIALLALSLAISLCAETAILQDIKGKVEIKPLGKDWMVAKNGMKVDLLSTISTGFDSSVVLVIADNKVAVAPLTRLTLDKIVAQAGKLNTSLHLRVGTVTAEVKSSKGVSQDFKVTSPYSTASVRGTIFVYDGFYLDVRDGTVAFIPGKPPRDIVVPAAVRARQPAAGGTPAAGAAEGEGGAPEGEAQPGEGEGGTPEGEAGPGEGEGGPPEGEGGPPEGGAPTDEELAYSPMDFGLADFMAALEEEFVGDSFELSDESGAAFEPPPPPEPTPQPETPGGTPVPTPTPTPAPAPIPPQQETYAVRAGSSAEIAIDYATPATPEGPKTGGVTQGQGGGTGGGTPPPTGQTGGEDTSGSGGTTGGGTQ